jgi:serine/threonine protein kinase
MYMAPELTLGARSAKPASDVYSWGVIAYEVLTGALPFKESPILAKLEGRAVIPPPPVRERCPSLTTELAALVDASLSSDPEARPTAAMLEAAFLRSATAA